jgi:hypothetical protein
MDIREATVPQRDRATTRTLRMTTNREPALLLASVPGSEGSHRD